MRYETNTRIATRAIWIFLVVVNTFLASCGQSKNLQDDKSSRVSGKGVLVKSYSRDETSRKKIILNSKKIIKGMSAEQVLKLLGKPNYDEIVSGKKAGESNYRMLTYYFNIDDLDSVSDGANLSMVCLFSLDGKLIKMISGIPGIKSLAKD